MHISLTPPDFITEGVVETSPVNTGNQTSGSVQNSATKTENSSQLPVSAPVLSPSTASDHQSPASIASSGIRNPSSSSTENTHAPSAGSGTSSALQSSHTEKPAMHLKEEKDGISIELSGNLDLKKSIFLWNGKPVFAEEGEFFLKMEEDGRYVFSYELIDLNGQVLESREEVFVQDRQAPEIITKDFEDTFRIYEKGEVPVEIEDLSPTTMKVYVDGKQIDADGGIIVDVSMSTIRIEAMDEHGNRAEKTIQIEKLPDPLDGSLQEGWKVEAQPSLEQDQMSVLLWDGEELVEHFPFDQAQQILLDGEKKNYTLFFIDAQGKLRATKNLIFKDETPVLKPSDLTEPETENKNEIYEEDENTLTFLAKPSSPQNPSKADSAQKTLTEIQKPAWQQTARKQFISAGAAEKDKPGPSENADLLLKWNNKILDKNFPVFLAEKELDDFRKENDLHKDLSFLNPETGKRYAAFKQALEESEGKMLYLEGTIQDENGNCVEIMQPVMEKQQIDWNRNLESCTLATRFSMDQEGKLSGKVFAEPLSSPLFSLRQIKNPQTDEKELRLYTADPATVHIEVNGSRLENPESGVDERGVKYFTIPRTRNKMHVTVYDPQGNLLYEEDFRVDGPLVFALFCAFAGVLAVPVLFEWKKRGYLKYFKSHYEVRKANSFGGSSGWIIRKKDQRKDEKLA